MQCGAGLKPALGRMRPRRIIRLIAMKRAARVGEAYAIERRYGSLIGCNISSRRRSIISAEPTSFAKSISASVIAVTPASRTFPEGSSNSVLIPSASVTTRFRRLQSDFPVKGARSEMRSNVRSCSLPGNRPTASRISKARTYCRIRIAHSPASDVASVNSVPAPDIPSGSYS